MAVELKWRYVEDLSGTRFAALEAVSQHANLSPDEFKATMLKEFGVPEVTDETTSAAQPAEEK